MSYNDLRIGRVSFKGQCYLVTSVTHHRIPLFANLHLGRIVVDTMKQSDEQALTRTIGFVVMPDHVHWLFSFGEGASLASVLHLFKGRSARRVNHARRSYGPIWQPSFHDRAVRETESLIDVARYVVMNPVRAGIVTKIGNYPLWDCMWATALSSDL